MYICISVRIYIRRWHIIYISVKCTDTKRFQYTKVVVGDEIFIYRHITRVIIFFLLIVSSSDDRAFRSNGIRPRSSTIKCLGMQPTVYDENFYTTSLFRLRRHIPAFLSSYNELHHTVYTVSSARWYGLYIARCSIRIRTRIIQLQKYVRARVMRGNVI